MRLIPVAVALAMVPSLWGQFAQPRFKWYCKKEDGKFTMTPCAKCKKFYCWDGEIFSEEEGYTPPPAYVLEYWEKQRQHSEQIRADIARKGEELKQKVQQAGIDTQRLNAESARKHQEFMSSLERKGGSRPKSDMMASTVPPAPPQVPAAIPNPDPIARAKLDEVKAGMERGAVIEKLGAPHAKVAISTGDGEVELLTYKLEGSGSAKIRLEQGKVVSVKLSE